MPNPTAFSNPVGIAAYEGLVYFTEGAGNKIGQLTVMHGETVSLQTAPEGLPIVIDDVEYKGGNVFEWPKGSAHTFLVSQHIIKIWPIAQIRVSSMHLS